MFRHCWLRHGRPGHIGHPIYARHSTAWHGMARHGADIPTLYAARVSAVERRFAQGPPQGQVLLTGSSFIERWESSSTDLAPLETVNVGIGGTKIGDQAAYMDRLVTPFRPRAVGRCAVTSGSSTR